MPAASRIGSQQRVTLRNPTASTILWKSLSTAARKGFLLGPRAYTGVIVRMIGLLALPASKLLQKQRKQRPASIVSKLEP